MKAVIGAVLLFCGLVVLSAFGVLWAANKMDEAEYRGGGD